MIIARDGGHIPIYRAEPPTPGPALVIVPSIFGVAPDVVTHANHFASIGALVLAIDPFWRTVPGALRFGPDTDAALARMRSHDSEKGHADLLDVIRAAKQDPAGNGKVICLGICFGGRFAFVAAADGQVDASAAWHGGRLGSLLHRAEDISVPLELDFGDRDPSIPSQEVARIRDAFASHPDVHIREHVGAGHGFSHIGLRPWHEVACDAGIAAVDRLIRSFAE